MVATRRIRRTELRVPVMRRRRCRRQRRLRSADRAMILHGHFEAKTLPHLKSRTDTRYYYPSSVRAHGTFGLRARVIVCCRPHNVPAG